MKKTAIVVLMNLYFVPCVVASSVETYDDSSNTLQEWCAKEEDPVQRLHYCHLLETKADTALMHKDRDIEILTS